MDEETEAQRGAATGPGFPSYCGKTGIWGGSEYPQGSQIQPEPSSSFQPPPGSCSLAFLSFAPSLVLASTQLSISQMLAGLKCSPKRPRPPTKRTLVGAFLQYAQGVIRFSSACVDRCTSGAQTMNETQALSSGIYILQGKWQLPKEAGNRWYK